MTHRSARSYLANSFLWLVPVMVWNSALTDQLPRPFQADVFWNNISPFLAYGENSSRMAVFALALFTPFHLSTRVQKTGLCLYLVGLLVYFAAWLVLIRFPESSWSTGLAGFTAPSYTPAVWLAGIGLMGDSFYGKLPFSRWYFFGCALIFLLFHIFHASIIFYRLHS
ncbi:hypothetical protein ACO2Q8_19210 [Larkinella sp. VNQ87]